MELPVVSDVVAEVTKITEPYTPLVEEGFKILKDKAMVMQEQVGSCVDTLDNIASDGLDKLTTAVPALHTKTPELIETTKTTAISFIDTAQEVIASFKVARFGIRIVDACMSVIDPIIPSAIVTKVRSVRRHLRAVRRAGAKLDGVPCNESSLLMEMAKMLKLNFLLSFMGMQLVTVEDNESSNPMKSGVQEADEDEMEDPDYVPNGTDSDESLEYRSDTELTQDSQSQEDEVTQDSQEDEVAVVELEDCPTTPNCVKVEHKVPKDVEKSEEEVSDELGSDIEQVLEVDASEECNTPACAKVEHTNAVDVVVMRLGSGDEEDEEQLEAVADEDSEQQDEVADDDEEQVDDVADDDVEQSDEAADEDEKQLDVVADEEEEQLAEVADGEECLTPKCVKVEHEGRRFQEDEA